MFYKFDNLILTIFYISPLDIFVSMSSISCPVFEFIFLVTFPRNTIIVDSYFVAVGTYKLVAISEKTFGYKTARPCYSFRIQKYSRVILSEANFNIFVSGDRVAVSAYFTHT